MLTAHRLVLLLSLLAAGACVRPVAPTNPDAGPSTPDVPGILGGRCIDGGFCNDDLICVDDVCVQDASAGEGEGEVGEGEGEGESCPDGDTDSDGACNSDDCNDDNPSVFPGARESCDDVDSNCDGRMNDDLDCTFLAHDRDTTFAIDPFARTLTLLGDITLVDNASMLDVDRDTDGKLLTVTSNGIYEIRPNGQLLEVADVSAPTGTNGMAINDDGELYLTTSDGADSGAWRVDRTVTPANLVEVGGFSNDQVSSGDCVFTKTGDLLMSIKNPDNADADDVLVEIDVETGSTTVIGSIGFRRVFGLSASFNGLFGVTQAGEVIEINPNTGAGTLLFLPAPPAGVSGDHIFFNGAANGD